MSDMSRSTNEAINMFALSESSVAEADVHFGYLVDLQKYSLGEGEGTSRWIQAFPYGEWSHPQYGKIIMNAERAARMAAGINQGVRDQDLPINYDHGEQRKDAAGWIQRADTRPDGLWVLVDWTREAFQRIKDKGYKYFSPEYANEWKHPANGQTFKDVFFGGALTNMPHLKGILPLNLAEHITVPEQVEKTAIRSLMETYAELCSIKFDDSTTDDSLKTQIITKFNESKKTAAKPPAPKVDPEVTHGSILFSFKEADWEPFTIAITESTRTEGNPYGARSS